jgi:hypothetical protein
VSDSPPLRWIRITERNSPRRFHAVYAVAYGITWTYCGRSSKDAGILDTIETPEEAEQRDPRPMKCGACQSRINHPWNVPDKLQRLRA